MISHNFCIEGGHAKVRRGLTDAKVEIRQISSDVAQAVVDDENAKHAVEVQEKQAVCEAIVPITKCQYSELAIERVVAYSPSEMTIGSVVMIRNAMVATNLISLPMDSLLDPRAMSTAF